MSQSTPLSREHVYTTAEVMHYMTQSVKENYGDLKLEIGLFPTYGKALEKINISLDKVKEKSFTLPRHLEPDAQNRLREMAIQDLNYAQEISTLPIRTLSEKKLSEMSPFQPISKATQARLKENAKNSPDLDPYMVTLRAGLFEKMIPSVKANLSVQSLAWSTGFPVGGVEATEMLWDTGAHTTMISEELFLPEFRAHLHDKINDEFRCGDGNVITVSVQLQVQFTNTIVEFTTIGRICSRYQMPNNMVGVLFGQQGAINSIAYKSVPANILKKKNENVADNEWGDIVIEELLDIDGELITL